VGYNISYLGIPQYTCLRNWYLDPNGSDANSGDSASAPWRTLTKADSSVEAGDCVNLAAGTYALNATVTLNHGGNVNSSTGYVVYRGSTPLTGPGTGAHIVMNTRLGSITTDSMGKFNGSIGHLITMYDPNNTAGYNSVNYLIFDGIEFDGNNNNVNGACIQGSALHHIVVENNIIHGCGSGGTGFTGDYHWYINNLVYENAGADFYYEGSGIDIYYAGSALEWDPAFTPNAADKALPRHMILAFNNVHDNGVLPSGCPGTPHCGTNGEPYHTDGNGIILDDWNHTQGDNNVYTGGALVVGNIAYNNGGAGIELYEATNVIAANNSTYNNYTDVEITGANRGEIACGPCMSSQLINNATYAVVGSTAPLSDNTGYYINSQSSSTAFTTNIGYPRNNGSAHGTGNQFGMDPYFAAGGNFILQPGSPALGTGTLEPWLTSTTFVNIGQWQQ